MAMNIPFKHIWIPTLFLLAGCGALRTTGDVVYNVGKVGWGTAKVAGKVVKTTGEVAYKTGSLAHKGARTIVYMAKGKQIVPLEREGNSFYATVVLNRRVHGRFIVDTGASSMQISRSMARRLGVDLSSKNATMVRLAGGYGVKAYAVNLREVKIGGARVKNVRAIVLDEDQMGMRDGLIGMSFLENFDFQMNPQKAELILQQKAI